MTLLVLLFILIVYSIIWRMIRGSKEDPNDYSDSYVGDGYFEIDGRLYLVDDRDPKYLF